MAERKAGKSSPKLGRSSRNKSSGKYLRQRTRTDGNKARRIRVMVERFPKWRPVGWMPSQMRAGEWVRG